jgi:hypothetical protein
VAKNLINIPAKNLEASQVETSLGSAIKTKLVKSLEDLVSQEAYVTLSEKEKQQKPQSPVVKSFGFYSNGVTSYPNDVIRLDIENANNQYLESNYRVDGFIQSNNEITLDPEKNLSDLNYISGKYKVTYAFHRNLLGSGDGHKLQIQEISADGLEIRVVPAISNNISNVDFLDFFADSFFKLPKSQTLTNLFLFKDANTPMRVFDYVQDKFTFSTTPYSIIFKLNTPAPDGVNIGDLIWLSQQVSDSLVDTITIVPPKIKTRKTLIAGPNWDAINKDQTAVGTQYKDWDDLLSSTSQTSEDIIKTLLSSSFLEGINLNIDFRHFNNHIQFGSATERLLNFKYKMQLIESYDSRIAALTTDLTGLPSSSVSSSTYFQTNITDTKTKKAALLGSMDSYEKYLFYQSSSYVTNSFGEFYPSTWPKSNSTKPYTNYAVTSSQVEEWFDGIYSSASLYDQNNQSALYKLIPAHVLEDSVNEEYVLFTHMIGHYYDLMFAYIKHMTKLHTREESILEGFSKDLIYHVGKNLGIDFENGNSLKELWDYALGTSVSGSLASTYSITSEDKTKETWKRIINNLPYLLKTKGTERGIRALINCFGIPQTILRIREYGGAEPEFDTKTDWVHERFNYSTTIGYNGQTSGNPIQAVKADWDAIGSQSLYPNTIEVRAKMAVSQSKVQRLMEKSGSWYLEASMSGASQYLKLYVGNNGGSTSTWGASTAWATASVSCSVYDGEWYHIAVKRSQPTNTDTVSQTYTLVVKKAKYEKVVFSQSASISVNGSTSQSYNNGWTTSHISSSNLWLPGTGSYTIAQSHSANLWTGSIQELRYWSEPLQDSILDNHTLAPTSYQGNLADTYTGSTSSFYTLLMRHPLGADNKKLTLTGSNGLVVSSSHPNQQYKTSTNLYAYNFSGSIHKSNVEIHSMEWPDLGTNRQVGNKIRIDETFLAGDTQLYRDNKAERSLTDNYPADTPRLGVYLSPVNEVNQDIAEQFGGLSIDDFIGTPGDLNKDHYPDLENLQYEYLKKYTIGRYRPQNYIRLIQHFDSALFQLIKKFVPHRANTQVGFVIEPNILTRSKIATKLPTFEENHYSSSLDVGPETYITPGGFVQDGDGEPFRDGSGYVQEGTIGGDESDYITLGGDQQSISEFNDVISYPTYEYESPRRDIESLPAFEDTEIDFVVLDGTNLETTPDFASSYANEFTRVGVDDNPSTSGSMAGEAKTRTTAYGRDLIADGSQYVFTSYYQSGSGAGLAWIPFTSSRYDYHEPYSPVIMDNTPSNISNVSGDIYDIDIYGGKAFSNHTAYSSIATSATNTKITSSAAWDENAWLSQYGLQIRSLYSTTTALDPVSGSVAVGYWSLAGTTYDPNVRGLHFYQAASTGTPITASLRLPAFFYNEDDPKTKNYIYEITISTDETGTGVTNYLELHFGDLDCGLTGSVTPTSTQTDVVFTTSALGNWLGLRLYIGGSLSGTSTWIPKLKVRCLNYRADVQDFHLRDSYGMRNARYDGCKMSSTDWNINSPDTSDGGPVVQVTVGGGKQLGVKPNVKGTFEIK